MTIIPLPIPDFRAEEAASLRKKELKDLQREIDILNVQILTLQKERDPLLQRMLAIRAGMA